MADVMARMQQMMMSDPKMMALFRLFSDKQLAITVLRKQREIFLAPEVMQTYEQGYDPSREDGLVKFAAIYDQMDRKVMEECGLGDYVKDIQDFKIMKFVVPVHIGDPEACVLNGSLAKLFSDYRDRVNFLCIYLAEAHPKGKWNFGPRYCFMEQHKTLEDRIQAARDLMAIDNIYNTFTTSLSDDSKIPLVLDTMDNRFSHTYSAHPDRVIIIGSDSRIAYIGRVIAMQFDNPHVNMADEARQWLQQNL